jgi:hypothetical protein
MNGLNRPRARRVFASARVRYSALAVAVVVGSVIAVAAAGARSNSGNAPQGTAATAPGTTVHVTSATQNIDFLVSFGSAGEQHQITVDTQGQAGPVTASSEDCCIPDDHWQSTIIDVTGGNPPLGTVPTSNTKIGTGSTTAFSGKAKLGSASNPFNGVARVHVTYAVGVDSFPAFETERITAPVGSIVTFDY